MRGPAPPRHADLRSGSASLESEPVPGLVGGTIGARSRPRSASRRSVSAADEAISSEEEAQIRQIASEIGFEHAEYVQIRMGYSAKRSVLKK